jgi:hypothetical protein
MHRKKSQLSFLCLTIIGFCFSSALLADNNKPGKKNIPAQAKKELVDVTWEFVSWDLEKLRGGLSKKRVPYWPGYVPGNPYPISHGMLIFTKKGDTFTLNIANDNRPYFADDSSPFKGTELENAAAFTTIVSNGGDYEITDYSADNDSHKGTLELNVLRSLYPNDTNRTNDPLRKQVWHYEIIKQNGNTVLYMSSKWENNSRQILTWKQKKVEIAPQEDFKAAALKQIKGAWKLENYLIHTQTAPGAPVVQDIIFWPNPAGTKTGASGTISYSKDGSMITQIEKDGRPLIPGDNQSQGTNLEKSNAFKTDAAYAGWAEIIAYDENTKLGTVAHHVEETWYPNWRKKELSPQVRYFEIKDDGATLIITTPPGGISGANQVQILYWKRELPSENSNLEQAQTAEPEKEQPARVAAQEPIYQPLLPIPTPTPAPTLPLSSHSIKSLREEFAPDCNSCVKSTMSWFCDLVCNNL